MKTYKIIPRKSHTFPIFLHLSLDILIAMRSSVLVRFISNVISLVMAPLDSQLTEAELALKNELKQFKHAV